MNPQFLDQMKSLLSSEYPDFIKSLEEPCVKGFYTNPLKKDVLDHLPMEYIIKHPYISNGYYYDYTRYAMGKSPYFNCGLYYIQEPSAMVVSHLLPIQEDDYILDMCSAPGGKACHVATQLSSQGLLVANDINRLRAKILSQNIERFGISNAIVTNIDPTALPDTFPAYFDKIYLDAPCSGEGMFRKLERAKDDWSMNKVDACVHIQRNLIKSAYQMLKQGGYLIYSTCTYNTKENEDTVRYALQEFGMKLLFLPKQKGMEPGINMPEAIRLYPHKNRGEGQFIAVLIKESCENVKHKIPVLKSNVTGEQHKLVTSFYQQYLNLPIPSYLYQSQNHIYAIERHFPHLPNIPILRTGLHLGQCKKGRFEPSLSLALTLQQKDVKNYYTFKESDPEIVNYLKGLTLRGTKEKGYGVIFADTYPLSFYKESNGQIKNLYPKGLRNN